MLSGLHNRVAVVNSNILNITGQIRSSYLRAPLIPSEIEKKYIHVQNQIAKRGQSDLCSFVSA